MTQELGDGYHVHIARHGEMELAEARRRARDMLTRIRAGGTPRTSICGTAIRTGSPAAQDRAQLSQVPHPANVRQDAASKDRPGAANRTFEILRSMIFRAEEWGLRERGVNPCLGIAKNPRNNVARFLDTDYLFRLGCALDARAAEWPEAVAAIRLPCHERTCPWSASCSGTGVIARRPVTPTLPTRTSSKRRSELAVSLRRR